MYRGTCLMCLATKWASPPFASFWYPLMQNRAPSGTRAMSMPKLVEPGDLNGLAMGGSFPIGYRPSVGLCNSPRSRGAPPVFSSQITGGTPVLQAEFLAPPGGCGDRVDQCLSGPLLIQVRDGRLRRATGAGDLAAELLRS